MGENTKIEWAHHTFNPWYGCQKVGHGCDHCYAEGWAKRSGLVQWGPGTERRRSSAANWRKPLAWNTAAERLGIRYRVFCASLADVFDNAVPADWRRDLFDLIARTPRLDWLLVTKRVGNVGNMLPVPFDFDHIYPNVWIGISVVNQEEADRDIPKLLDVPARVRFLSMEPLLGPVDLSDHLACLCGMCGGEHLDWVIVGGESGPGARPMQPDWVRSIRDQCDAMSVPFLFKQWGEWAPNWLNDNAGVKVPGSEWIDKMGKKSAGRLLDGVQHDGYPGLP